MKKLLPIQLFLFVVSMFLTFNASAQTPPDPGIDPLHTMDSAKQNPALEVYTFKQSGMNVIISKDSAQLIPITECGDSAKANDEKAIPSLKTE